MGIFYQSYYEKQYKAPLISCTSISTLFIYLIAIVIPFVFVFYTNDLWVKQSFYYEQPLTSFSNEIFLEVLDQDGNSRQYSTLRNVSEISQNQLSQPIIKVQSQDLNNDGKVDNYYIKITFKSDPTKVRKVRVFSVFQYFIQSKLKMKMTGMLQLLADTPLGASSIISNGDMELLQQKPVLIQSLVRSKYSDDPLTTPQFQQFDIDQIYDNYTSRNEQILYNQQTIVQSLGSSFSTTIEMNIQIQKSQKIYYIPGVMETLKFGWIQYIMFLIPILWLTNLTVQFLFKYKIFESLMVSDLKSKKKIM